MDRILLSNKNQVTIKEFVNPTRKNSKSSSKIINHLSIIFINIQHKFRHEIDVLLKINIFKKK